MRKGDKRGQLTLFIILGLLIVSIIFVFFFYIQPNFSFSSGELQVETCVKKVISDEVTKLALTGGIVNPDFKYLYLGENITMMCYTEEYYKPCVVQHPFLTKTFEESLTTATKEKIENCYKKSVDELRSNGYEVIQGTIKTTIKIEPSQISVSIDSPTVISSIDASRTLNKFETKIYSELYEVLAVANSILQFETSYGDVDVGTLMIYYPDLIIQKIRRDEGVKIYTLTNKKEILFKFASRSYAWPPGYGT